jgi:anthranilate phosphoribosyltransferase
MSIIKHTLNALTDKHDLDVAVFNDVLDYMLSGHASDIEMSGFLSAFTMIPVQKKHLLSAVIYLRKKMIRVDAPENAVDCCGTGGDSEKTGGSLNISTATAFFAAAAGLIVAKHGNRSVSSRSGSADVLESLGYKIQESPSDIAETLRKTSLCFMFAPYFHPSLKYVSHIRKALGIKTFFNLLGPMLNPASVKYQMIGVYDFRLAPMMAEILRDTGTHTALIVHSADGADELTLSGINHYVLLKNNEISVGTLSPDDVDLPIYPPDSLLGGDADYNANALKNICAGQSGAYRDTVLLNTGALLYISGHAPTIATGVTQAKQIKNVDLKVFLN